MGWKDSATNPYGRERVPRLFANLAVLECDTPATLAAVLAGGLQPYVVRQLSDRVVVLDHENLEAIQKLLKKSGRTPKITEE